MRISQEEIDLATEYVGERMKEVGDDKSVLALKVIDKCLANEGVSQYDRRMNDMARKAVGKLFMQASGEEEGMWCHVISLIQEFARGQR